MADVETPVAPATPEPELSVAEHAQNFGAEALREAPQTDESDDLALPDAAPVEERPRHRAASQRAKAGDVDEINALTRQLREAEEEIGIKKQPNESARAFGLRRQLEIANALREMRKGASEAKTVTPPVRPAPPPQTPTSGFTDREPQLEDFKDKADPYAAWVRATTSWDRKKEEFEARTQQTQAQTQEQIAAADAGFRDFAKKTALAHEKRLEAFVASNPKAKEIFDGVIARNDIDLSPVTLVAIHTSENGPEMMLALAQNPELADDLLRESVNQTAFDARHQMNPLVAFQQRRLARAVQTLQAGTTGSAAGSRPIAVAPRPLNPVRTVPQTPSETPPTEGSVADHARVFGQRRR